MYVLIGVAAFILGVVLTALIIARAVKVNNARRRMARGGTAEPSKRKFEFSKLILLLVMLTYFATVVVGVKLSFIDYTQYSTLAILVGTPTATAIGFYAWKAKAENVVKIKKENPQETEGVSVDPSNIL